MHPSSDDLSAYLDEELEPRRRAEVATHLGGCPTCRQSLEELQWVVAYTRAMPRRRVPPGVNLGVPVTAPRRERPSIFGLGTLPLPLALTASLVVAGFGLMLSAVAGQSALDIPTGATSSDAMLEPSAPGEAVSAEDDAMSDGADRTGLAAVNSDVAAEADTAGDSDSEPAAPAPDAAAMQVAVEATATALGSAASRPNPGATMTAIMIQMMPTSPPGAPDTGGAPPDPTATPQRPPPRSIGDETVGGSTDNATMAEPPRPLSSDWRWRLGLGLLTAAAAAAAVEVARRLMAGR